MVRLLTLILLLSSTAYSDTFELSEASIKSYKLLNGREPTVPNKELSFGGAAILNTNILTQGYWDNLFHFDSAERKVIYVGWEFEAGYHLTNQIDLFYYHHSEHSADVENVYEDRQKYPLRDAIGVKFIFYKK
jgi:hypothetical protein